MERWRRGAGGLVILMGLVGAGALGAAPPGDALPGPPAPSLPAPPPTLAADAIHHVSASQIQAWVAAQTRPVVVHLWATWCAPCEAEVRELGALSGRLGGRAVIVGVSADLMVSPGDGAEAPPLRPWLDARGARYPSFLCTAESGRSLLSWLEVQDGVPATTVFGPGGVVWARFQRAVRAAEVVDVLDVNGLDVADLKAPQAQ